MRLVIVRHAEAAPGKPDELRHADAGRPRPGAHARRAVCASRASSRTPSCRARCCAPARRRAASASASRRSTSGSRPGATPDDVRDAAERTRRDGRRRRPPARLRPRRRGARAAAPSRRSRRAAHALVELDGRDARSPSAACASRTARSRPCAASTSRSSEGEVFGLLGPNGAGKTTTVEILEGYRTRDAGEVTVLGHDPQRPGPRVPASASASCCSSRSSGRT